MFPIWSWLILLPLFLYTGAVWHIDRLISRELAFKTGGRFERIVVTGAKATAVLGQISDNYSTVASVTIKCANRPKINVIISQYACEIINWLNI
jgi:hypothetical protein